ncbi:MAG: hypothetical protein WBD36_10520, partial [Bacteroidota bacterium]
MKRISATVPLLFVLLLNHSAARTIAISDTSVAIESQDISRPTQWLTIDIRLGVQFLNTKWDPYTTPLFMGASCQRRFGESPWWLDASILVGRQGGVDPGGAGNGPGVSLVGVRVGVGQWWNLESSDLSFFAGGGVSYDWAQLHLWEGKEGGSFIGGYLRS